MSVVCALAFSSCEKIKEKIFESFTAKGADVQFTIPVVASTANETTIATTNVNFNVDSTIKASTGGVFSVDILKQVNPEEITLNLLNPGPDQANNLANFESLKVRISTQSGNNPIVIASMSNPDAFATSVNLTVDNSKQLLDLLKSSAVRYEVLGKARRATTKQLNAQLVVKLKFK
jgi:hypothetical protein